MYNRGFRAKLELFHYRFFKLSMIHIDGKPNIKYGGQQWWHHIALHATFQYCQVNRCYIANREFRIIFQFEHLLLAKIQKFIDNVTDFLAGRVFQ